MSQRTSILIPLLVAAAGCDASTAAGPSAGDGPATTIAAAQGPDPVIVQNTANNPVPTRAVGTTAVTGTVAASQSGAWTVGIAGGSVAASQSGPWSVGAAQSGDWNVRAAQQGAWTVEVASAPPVSLAAGATVGVSALPPVSFDGAQPVEITNLPAVTVDGFVAVRGAVAIANEGDAPVPVRVVGGGHGQEQLPWEAGSGTLNFPADSPTVGAAIYTVPAGKRLVIEYIDAYTWSFSSNVRGFRLLVTLDGPGDDVTHTLPFAVSQAFTGFGQQAVAQTVRWYGDPGEVVRVEAQRDGFGGGSAEITMSGYLIDA